MSRDSLYTNPSLPNKINQILMTNYFDASTVVYLHTGTIPDIDTLKTSNKIAGWAIKSNIGTPIGNKLTQYFNVVQAIIPVTTGIITWFELESFGSSLFGTVCDIEDINNGTQNELIIGETDLSINATPQIIDLSFKIGIVETQS